eukprot:SAG31_NODE_4197_length_3483_cov_1.755319_2_plen_511_part_00
MGKKFFNKLGKKLSKASGSDESAPLLGAQVKTAQSQKRDSFLDNAKFWLQTLVVMKHIPVFWGHSPYFPQEALGNYAESFFMQMYVFTSGYVDKGTLDQRRAANTVVNIWLPLIMVTALIRVRQTILAWISGDTARASLWTMTAWNPLSGGDGLWFLTVILVLKLLKPFMATLKPHYLLCAAYGLSWWSGYWWTESDAQRLAIGQTLNMMPFYFTGYCMTGTHLKLLKNKFVRALGLAITILYLGWQLKTGKQATAADYWVASAPSEYWLRTSSEGYYFGAGVARTGAVDTMTYLTIWQQRLAGQCVAWVTGFSFLSLIPHEKTRFSEFGQRSMYAYIAQFFILYPPVQIFAKFVLGNAKGHLPSGPESVPMWALLYLLSPVMCAALSTKFVQFIFCPFLAPVWFGKLFIRDGDKIFKRPQFPELCATKPKKSDAEAAAAASAAAPALGGAAKKPSKTSQAQSDSVAQIGTFNSEQDEASSLTVGDSKTEVAPRVTDVKAAKAEQTPANP